MIQVVSSAWALLLGMCLLMVGNGMQGTLLGIRGGIEGFLALPGIAQTPAAEASRIFVYDDSLLLSLGPRSGELLDLIVSDLHPDLSP